jgi:hypothetical protein
MFVVCMILFIAGVLVFFKIPILGIILFVLANKAFEMASPRKEEAIIPFLAMAAFCYVIFGILSNIFDWGLH